MVPRTEQQSSDGAVLEARLIRALSNTTADPGRPLSLPDVPAQVIRSLGIDAVADLTPAAVLIPIRRHARTPSVILNLRSRALRHHAGQISFPGGRREAADDGPVANALREAREEMALDPAQVSVIGFLDDYPTISGFRVTPVVAMVDAGASVCADGVEVDELFEVPLTFLLAPNNYHRQPIDHDGVDVFYYEIPYRERHIWGATAGMLHELALRCADIS